MIGWPRRSAGVQTCVAGSILFPEHLPAVAANHQTVSASWSHIGDSSRTDSTEFLTRRSPRLPQHTGIRTSTAVGVTSLLIHVTAVFALVVLAGISSVRRADVQAVGTVVDPPRLVFMVTPLRAGPGGGGGGGGNRQLRPIPRAQAPGRDPMTLPVARPIVARAEPVDELPAPQALAIEAKPLTSGLAIQVGLLEGLPTLSSSLGPGVGGGAGDGMGTGIGSGRGPGIGPGSGGGMGGGIYRPGNGVTSPTLLMQVKPTYTAQALRAKIQGTVLLEAVVQADGTPRDIRVIRSLDRFGLDQQAALTVAQWRFGPGRLNGVPVDVLVAIELEFSIR